MSGTGRLPPAHWHPRTATLTWRHPRGDGGGGKLALALGGHGSHLDGVGGEGSEAGDAVLQGDVGQVMGHPCVGAVVFLPGDPVAWNAPCAVSPRHCPPQGAEWDEGEMLQGGKGTRG